MTEARFTVDELRGLEIFQDLSEDELAWFSEHGTRMELDTGEHMMERGDPADYMFVVVRGAIDGYEEIDGQWLAVARTKRGQVTGMLPFSRMTRYPRYGVALEPSGVLVVHKRHFQEMLSVSLEVGQRLVAVMSDRVRGNVRLEQQREKMMALGKLSAGLAHELNNPAAAVSRAASALSKHLATLSGCITGLLGQNLDGSAIEAIRELPARVRARRPPSLSPLERAEMEENLADWLEEHGVSDQFRIAGSFADAGVGADDLSALSAEVPAGALRDAILWIECGLAAEKAAAEIVSAANRISSLITSVKTYSHMDRSSAHKLTDVREGLDSTLTMLAHKLKKKGIRLERDYQKDLPAIPAHAGELNQVWTNLIDNAIDAMGEGGTLSIEAREEETGIVVRVIDDGHGIPEELRPRIFDPFFTTKGVGEGTGLGLDIAARIVGTHRGHIDVQSRPGRTEMSVHLPVSS